MHSPMRDEARGLHGDSLEHFAGGETLDDPDELARAIGRNRLHEEVHVVPVGPNFEKRDVVPGGNLQTNILEGGVHLGRAHRPAVLHGTDEVVEQDGGIVAPMDVFAHAPSLPHGRGKPRGIKPQRMKNRRREMKNAILLTVLLVVGLVLFSGCASMQRWPDYERSAENKMVVIQEKIGDGLKTGALTPDQSQMFLTTLKDIRTEYTALRDKEVSRDEWNRLLGRLDVLGEEINRALARPARIEEPRNADRIVALQRRIDDGRTSGRLPSKEGRDYQSRLDSIRRDYLRMTEGGRSTTYEERADISRRLDSLETDLNRFR